MDLDPFTTGYLPDTVGSYIEWTVENLEGSKWNSFNIVGSDTVFSWSFDIIATYNPDNILEEPLTILNAMYQTITSRTKPQISVPVALAGFRRYRWEITKVGTTSNSLGSVHMAYCKTSGVVCHGIDKYPSVNEGQISPSTCPEGYRGYSYRECSGGVLSEVKTDKCSYYPPTNAQYSHSQYIFVMGTHVTTNIPTVKSIATRWYIDEGVILPDGLGLNENTGEIWGVPTAEQELTSFIVYAENESGATQTTVKIQIRKGKCVAEGEFPETDIGNVAEYDCVLKGSYVGIQKRACILGTEDGEWKETTGTCLPIIGIVMVVIVIVIVIILVFWVMKIVSKAKAMNSMKGKNTKSTKTLSKIDSTKQMKV